MSERLSAEELTRRLRGCPAAGSKWQHYGGDVVEVVTPALEEKSLAPGVAYRHGGLIFFRTLEDWNTYILGIQRRFTPMSEEST